jgi:hypothetical protein
LNGKTLKPTINCPGWPLDTAAARSYAMNSPDGSNSKIVVVSQTLNEIFPGAYAASLNAGAKSMNPAIINSTYPSFQSLKSTIGCSDVLIRAPMLSCNSNTQTEQSTNPTSITLSLKQEFGEKPDAMYLMYAIGVSPQLRIHTRRSCLDVVEFFTYLAPTSKGVNRHHLCYLQHLLVLSQLPPLFSCRCKG